MCRRPRWSQYGRGNFRTEASLIPGGREDVFCFSDRSPYARTQAVADQKQPERWHSCPELDLRILLSCEPSQDRHLPGAPRCRLLPSPPGERGAGTEHGALEGGDIHVHPLSVLYGQLSDRYRFLPSERQHLSRRCIPVPILLGLWARSQEGRKIFDLHLWGPVRPVQPRYSPGSPGSPVNTPLEGFFGGFFDLPYLVPGMVPHRALLYRSGRHAAAS